MASDFRFRSTWIIDAPIDALFDALHDYEHWPEWWPGAVRMAELTPPDDDGCGGRGAYEWRSPIGYRIRFEGVATEVARPHRLAGTVEGDLRGTGTWRLDERPDGAVALVYDWTVRTDRWWLGLLAPVLRPLLVANHDRLMRAGAEGLARHLGARLVSAS